jgi:glycosyltransferase involved in cell wall biosynthesis
MQAPFISMILPTRGRVNSLRRFLESVVIYTDRPHQLEIILVIDEDDRESIAFEFPGLCIKKRIVRPGQSMGMLNQFGFEVSDGRYLMLANDDVVIKTHHWDSVLKSTLDKWKDKMVLAHINDLIFQQTLCTFPIVSREYCEIAQGICPTGFHKYAIDDHIFSTFRIAAALGANRIIFFPFIIFSHLNYSVQSGRRLYNINPDIKSQDELLFHKLHDKRLNVAVEICCRTGIDPSLKRIRKMRQDGNSYRNALLPSRMHLGRPKWREFNIAVGAAFSQFYLKDIIRRLANKDTF